VEKAINNPDEVWQDYGDDQKSKYTKRCHYKKFSPSTYVKVVVFIKTNPCQVLTAFEINFIREASYMLKRFV
jgi:hypothetical protein